MAFPLTTLKSWSVSGGSLSAGGVPVLNSNGVLDPSLLNAVQSTGGTAQAAAIPQLNAAGYLDPSFFKGVSKSLGSANVGNVPLLNAAGLLDLSFLGALVAGGGTQQYLDVLGWRFFIGTGTFTPNGTHAITQTFSFPANTFATCQLVLPIGATASITSVGFNPVLAVTAINGGVSFVGVVDNNLANDPNDAYPINKPVVINYLAIGTPPSGTV
jgi:hypothetical protein